MRSVRLPCPSQARRIAKGHSIGSESMWRPKRWGMKEKTAPMGPAFKVGRKIVQN